MYVAPERKFFKYSPVNSEQRYKSYVVYIVKTTVIIMRLLLRSQSKIIQREDGNLILRVQS